MNSTDILAQHKILEVLYSDNDYKFNDEKSHLYNEGYSVSELAYELKQTNSFAEFNVRRLLRRKLIEPTMDDYKKYQITVNGIYVVRQSVLHDEYLKTLREEKFVSAQTNNIYVTWAIAILTLLVLSVQVWLQYKK